eukprot:gb/GECG01009463.1/.p1 GENE.gb/GECG01009463.1/~~gb/GECG01009463.1/.p1  ORF type:complete len:1425 (+),score=241.93 gb/GECG01009463.1/:1-4275(+)
MDPNTFSKLFALSQLESLGANASSLFECGNEFFKEGNYAKAVESWDYALLQGGPHPSIYFNKSLALYNLKRYHDALETINKALELCPSQSGAHMNKANILVALERYDDAVQEYQAEPQRTNELWQKLAMCYKQMQAPQRALGCYDMILSNNPRSSATYTNKGDALNLLGRYQDAERCLTTALRLDPFNAVAYDNKAYSLHQQGRYDDAMQFAWKSIQFGETAWSLIIIASCLSRKHEWDTARKSLAKAATLLQQGKCFQGASSPQEREEAKKLFEEVAQRVYGSSETATGSGSSSSNAPNEETSSMKCNYNHTTNSARSVPSEQQAKAVDLTNRGMNAEDNGELMAALELFEKAIRLHPEYAWAYEGRASVLFKLGNFKSAKDSFQCALKYDPRNDALYVGIARCLNSMEEHFKAQEYCDKAIALESSNTEAYVQKGRAQKLLGKNKDAIKQFDQALRNDPKCVEAFRGKCQAHLNLQNWSEALANCESALKVDNKVPSVMEEKACIFEKMGELGKALRCYEESVQLDSSRPESLIGQGSVLAQLNKHHDAIKCYDRAIELDKDRSVAYTRKGESLQSLGKMQEAMNCYESALNIDKNDGYAKRMKALCKEKLSKETVISYDSSARQVPEYLSDESVRQASELLNKGITLDDEGKPENALQCLEESVRLNPRYWYGFKIQGDVLSTLQRFSEAIEMYGKALKLDPRNADVMIGKSNALLSLGNLNEALRSANQAIQEDNHCSMAHVARAAALVKLGEYSKALESATRAVDVDPSCVDAMYNQARALKGLARYEEAVDKFNNVIEKDSGRIPARLNKGTTLIKQSKYTKAVKCFDEVIEIEPENSTAHSNKGTALAWLERYQEAFDSYSEALRIKPSDSTAKKNKDWVLQYLPESAQTTTQPASAQRTGGNDGGSSHSAEELDRFRLMLSQHAQTLEQAVSRSELTGTLYREAQEEEIRHIEETAILRDFYHGLKSTLFDYFMTAVVIQSGHVTPCSSESKTAVGLSVVEFLLGAVPIVSHISKGVNGLLRKSLSIKAESGLNNLLRLEADHTRIKGTVEEISRGFTLALADKIPDKLPDEQGLWEKLKSCYKKMFYSQLPESIHHAEGSSHGLAIVKECMKGHLSKEDFTTQHLLRVLIGEQAVNALEAKRGSMTTPAEKATWGRSPSRNPDSPGETSTTIAPQTDTIAEVRYLRQQLEEMKERVPAESASTSDAEVKNMMEEIATLKKQLAQLNKRDGDEDAEGDVECQQMLRKSENSSKSGNSSNSGSSVATRSEISAIWAALREMRITVTQMAEAPSLRKDFVSMRFEGAIIPFSQATALLKELVDEQHPEGDHRYVEGSASFRPGKRSIADELKGTSAKPPGTVTGTAILNFLSNKLPDVAPEKALEKFKSYLPDDGTEDLYAQDTSDSDKLGMLWDSLK